MLVKLYKLRELSKSLYTKYTSGLLTQVEYQDLLKPLDREIDRLEMKILNCYPPDTLACEISFS